MKGKTVNVSSTGALVECSKPLEYNEVFILDIDVPALAYSLKALAEMVWSSREGNEVGIAPCAMGIRFLRISGDDQRFIVKAVQEHLNSENVETASLEASRTMAIDQEKDLQ
jgi:hypothetical protein